MKVGVIGAGTMGAGICEVFAKAGWDVAMTASSAASAQKHKLFRNGGLSRIHVGEDSDISLFFSL